MKLNYRPEIDGLRAIAVIAVMIYHANFNFFNTIFLTGGYLGVDVFFVISGYLISSLILKEIKSSNNFSFINFYKRRFRRIIPVLLTVILTTIFLSWFFLLPSSFVELAKSSQYSILFSSNLFFYFKEIEYAGTDGLLKPLLHTWSLSVEEQYYIVFPLLIFFFYKFAKKYLTSLIVVLFLLSLFYSSYLSNINQSLNFYMLLTRGWELLAGTLIVLFKEKYENFKITRFINLIPFCFLTIIFFSMFLFNKYSKHPSLITLFPIIATSFIIFFSDRKNYINKILSNVFMVKIGLISYSLYLWHYPLFAFARNLDKFNTNVEKIYIIFLTFFLSLISYYLIEKPSRDRKNNFKYIFTTFIFLSLIALVTSNVIINKNGYDKREKFINNFGIKIGNYVLDQNFYLKNHFFKFSKSYSPDNFESAKKRDNKILVVGNSNSITFFQSILLNENLFKNLRFNLISPKKREEKINYFIDCFEKFLTNNKFYCEKSKFDFTDNILTQFKKADTVLLISRWDQDNFESLEKIIPILELKKKKIIIANMPVILDVFTDQAINEFDYFVYQNQRLPKPKELLELEKSIFKKLMSDDKFSSYRSINEKLDLLKKRYNFILLNQAEYQCEIKEEKCFLMTPEASKIYIDDIHITNEGAKFFGKRIYEKNLFNRN